MCLNDSSDQEPFVALDGGFSLASCLTSGIRCEAGALGSRKRSVLAGLLLGLLVTVGFASVAAGETGEPRVLFDIPSQRADKALTAFAEQVGVTLVFPFDLVSQTTANRADPVPHRRGRPATPSRWNRPRRVVVSDSYVTITKAQTDGVPGNMKSRFRQGMFGALLGFLSIRLLHRRMPMQT